jgi:uncharacterized protein
LTQRHKAVPCRAENTDDPETLFKMGVFFQHGKNGELDLDEAVRLFQLSASRGHAGSQNKLGFMYIEGIGLPRDEHAAVKFISLAADQGHSEAQYNLAHFHEAGIGGLPKNLPEAFRLYRLAAAQGHKLAAPAAKRVFFKM